MATDIETWARAERQFLRDELKWFDVGAKLISPSGDDITAKKIAELNARIEHVSQVLSDGSAS